MARGLSQPPPLSVPPGSPGAPCGRHHDAWRRLPGQSTAASQLELQLTHTHTPSCWTTVEDTKRMITLRVWRCPASVCLDHPMGACSRPFSALNFVRERERREGHCDESCRRTTLEICAVYLLVYSKSTCMLPLDRSMVEPENKDNN